MCAKHLTRVNAPSKFMRSSPSSSTKVLLFAALSRVIARICSVNSQHRDHRTIKYTYFILNPVIMQAFGDSTGQVAASVTLGGSIVGQRRRHVR